MVYAINDLNNIYNQEYSYSLPKTVLESFVSGKAFDHFDVYSKEESLNLQYDIHQIYESMLSTGPIKENLAIMTAGAPGAGKTYKMHQILKESRALGKEYAYIDPDDVCLKNQVKTYKADIASGDGSKEARLEAYNKWRPGSNAANHLILGNLIREKYGFCFGTTASGPGTGNFLDFLKKQGYQIRLIHVTAPDNIRFESIKERDKAFLQTTEQDTKEKGLLLPQRINDAFLKYADQIEFYYRDEVKQDAQPAATWSRNSVGSKKLGTLRIINPLLYEKVKAVHNSAVEVLKRPDLDWNESVEKVSDIL